MSRTVSRTFSFTQVRRTARSPDSNALYHICRSIGHGIFYLTINTHELNRQVIDRDGSYILALTHLSHVEPFCASVRLRRKIDWITRREFYKFRPVSWLLHALDTIKIDRDGIPVAAIRTAIARCRAGRVVGICPEGGVATGKNAAVRGGPMKRGVCSIALRAGVPIIPCVILGTHELNRVLPWIPFRRANIWIAYGHPIHPADVKSTRASRAQLAEQLAASMRHLYSQLLREYNIDDEDIP